jgi:hypothetical protein
VLTKNCETDSLADELNGVFNREVEIPRTRHGKKQTPDTSINEEALLLAKYLRNERETWIPRIPVSLSKRGEWERKMNC